MEEQNVVPPLNLPNDYLIEKNPAAFYSVRYGFVTDVSTSCSSLPSEILEQRSGLLFRYAVFDTR